MVSHVMRHLFVIQRCAFLESACRLSDTNALKVVAGQPLLDLVIGARAHKKSMKKNIPCVFQNFIYEGGESDHGIALDNLETAVECA